MSYRPIEWLPLLLAMLAYTGFVFWLFLRLLRAFKQKELTHQRTLLEAKFQAEKELYEAQQEIQEETFRQISRELHDSVGQTFSLAKLGLANLPLDNPAESIATVSEITDLMAKGISDLRDVSTIINAETVRTHGLLKAIESQKAFLERTGRYQVSFICNGELKELEFSISLIFYRILQESINNIIRHAKATEIRIQVLMKKNQLQMQIEDNGIGFDGIRITNGDMRLGGIANMRFRATTIGAELTVKSCLDQGTTVIITSAQAS